jgi:hypothetical protein
VIEAAAALGLIAGIQGKSLVLPHGQSDYVPLDKWSQTDDLDFARSCREARGVAVGSSLTGEDGTGFPWEPAASAASSLIGVAVGVWLKGFADQASEARKLRREDEDKLNELAQALQDKVYAYAEQEEAGPGPDDGRAAEEALRRLRTEIDRLSRAHADWGFLDGLRDRLSSEALRELRRWPISPDERQTKARFLREVVDGVTSDTSAVARAVGGRKDAEQMMIKKGFQAAPSPG